MDIVTQIFSALTTIAGEVITWLSGMFTDVAGVFYTPGVGETPGSLTLLGSLSLIGVGLGAFFFIFRWIRSLIQIRMGR